MNGYDRAASSYDNRLPPDDDPCSSCSWPGKLCMGCPVYEAERGFAPDPLDRSGEQFRLYAESREFDECIRRSSTQHEPEENRDPSGSANKRAPDN